MRALEHARRVARRIGRETDKTSAAALGCRGERKSERVARRTDEGGRRRKKGGTRSAATGDGRGDQRGRKWEQLTI